MSTSAPILNDLFLRSARDIVHNGRFVEQALWRACSTAAVVALNVDDQRVLQPAHFLDGVQDAAHLVVGVRKRRRIDLHHAGVDFFVVGIERIPRLDLLGARRELRVGGDDSQLLLSHERLFPHLVPALVELTL
jgi:hypothetical protein